MRAFLATSLRHREESRRIMATLDALSLDYYCSISDTGTLKGQQLFEHNVARIAEADLFIAILKAIGRDVSVEIGIAYALGKQRIGVLYDLEPEDVMPYFAAGDLVREEGLPAHLRRLCGTSHITFSDFSQHKLHRFVQGARGIFASKVFVEGIYTRDLERILEERFGRPAIVIGSGTAALTAALECFLARDRNEVIVPSLTFAATIQAIIQAGGVPRFVDVSPEDWTIDIPGVRAKLGPRTGAIMPVHLFGNPCDVETLDAMSEAARVPVVYDSCQAFGASTPKGLIGTFGDAEAFSLDATKVLSGVLGGFMTFRDANLADRARSVKNFGNDADRRTRVRGFNGRMSEFHALLACDSCLDVDIRIQGAVAAAAEYRHMLAGIRGVALQVQRHGVQCPRHLGVFLRDGDDDVAYRVRDELGHHGIETRIYNSSLLHARGLFTAEDYCLPVTESMRARILCLPTHGAVTAKHMATVADVLRRELR